MFKKISNFLIVILLTLISTVRVNAYGPEIFDRNTLPNLGVNKKWDIAGKEDYILSTYAVDASIKIYDFSNILLDTYEPELRTKIDDYISHTGFDMVILTDDYIYTNDEANGYHASDFYDFNDFGLKNEYYSGVLLFRNTYEQDKYFNIYTFGEAQLYYSYYELESVLDDIYPFLSNGQYEEGFSLFVDRMTDGYNNGIAPQFEHAHIDDMGNIIYDYVPNYLSIFIGAIIISGIYMFILLSKHKMIVKATKANEYIEKDKIVFSNKRDEFVRSHTSSYTHTSSSGGGSGGGSFSGHSGGGFSSGGGRHG